MPSLCRAVVVAEAKQQWLFPEFRSPNRRFTGGLESTRSVDDGSDGHADMTDDMRHYQQLKAELNRTTRNFAGILTVYLALVTSFDVRPPIIAFPLILPDDGYHKRLPEEMFS